MKYSILIFAIESSIESSGANLSLAKATFAAAIISASVSFIMIIFNFYQDRKKRQKDIVTSNRVIWMENLRNNIAESVKIVHSFINSDYSDSGLLNEYVRILNIISLLLNFRGKFDEEFRTILKREYKALRRLQQEECAGVYQNTEKIVEYIYKNEEFKILFSSIYLKCEWERVKVFSKKGEDSKFNFELEFKKYTDTDETKVDYDSLKKYSEEMFEEIFDNTLV